MTTVAAVQAEWDKQGCLRDQRGDMGENTPQVHVCVYAGRHVEISSETEYLQMREILDQETRQLV